MVWLGIEPTAFDYSSKSGAMAWLMSISKWSGSVISQVKELILFIKRNKLI